MSVLTQEEPRKGIIDSFPRIVEGSEIEVSPNGGSDQDVMTSLISGHTFSSNSDHREREIVSSYSIDMDDPYRYGWRYLTETVDDEIIVTGRIPLTLEDLLHPEEEDFRVQNLAHIEACLHLRTGASKQLRHRPNSLILYDVRVDWSFPDVRPFGPDVTVIMDGQMDPPDNGTYVTGEDGIAPIMIIEVTSPSTRSQDFYDKPIKMQKVGLPYYFVVDFATKKKRVYGYELNDSGHYIGIRPDDQG